MDLILKNLIAITADARDTVIRDAAIHIRDGKIAYIGATKHAPDEKAARTLDLKGAAALPGFVNTHTHLTMTLFRGAADDMPLMQWLNERIWPMEKRLKEPDAYWGSLLAFCEMASAGVTAFNDMYFYPEAILRAALQSGMTGYICRTVIDSVPGGDRMLKEAIALHEVCDGRDGIYVSLAPHAEYTVSKKMFYTLAETAKERGMRVHVHVSETKGEHEDCIRRNGVTPIGLFRETGLLESPVMAAHCVHVSDEDMDVMREAGVSVLSCPRSNLKLGSGIARVATLLRKGVNVSLGTDGAASNNALSVYNEMTLCALLQKGLTGDASAVPAAQAVRLATINGAAALGLDAVTGSLETGKRADIAIVDLSAFDCCPLHDPLAGVVYGGSGCNVAYTIAGGRVIYERGEILFADAEEVRARAREAAQRLTRD